MHKYAQYKGEINMINKYKSLYSFNLSNYIWMWTSYFEFISYMTLNFWKIHMKFWILTLWNTYLGYWNSDAFRHRNMKHCLIFRCLFSILMLNYTTLNKWECTQIINGWDVYRLLDKYGWLIVKHQLSI